VVCFFSVLVWLRIGLVLVSFGSNLFSWFCFDWLTLIAFDLDWFWLICIFLSIDFSYVWLLLSNDSFVWLPLSLLIPHSDYSSPLTDSYVWCSPYLLLIFLCWLWLMMLVSFVWFLRFRFCFLFDKLSMLHVIALWVWGKMIDII
jgi:hypothetical protein